MSAAHANAYRDARLAIDAALRARTTDTDDLVAIVWSDGDVSVRQRERADGGRLAGLVRVLVYVDGMPRWTADHPLPERSTPRARTWAGRSL